MEPDGGQDHDDEEPDQFGQAPDEDFVGGDDVEDAVEPEGDQQEADQTPTRETDHGWSLSAVSAPAAPALSRCPRVPRSVSGSRGSGRRIRPIARIRDTIPAFEAYARKAGLESPLRRELLWKDHYQAANSDVFKAFEEVTGPPGGGMAAMVKELSGIRNRVREAAPIMKEIIEELDPRLGELLSLPPEPSPVHVLMVGTFSTNALVARLGGDVAVFHCLEWFQTAEGTRVLVAHEGSHGWHELALERAGQTPPADDMAWMVFSEGFATQVSRAAVPEAEEIDYFWYGHPEAQGWLPWCREHIEELRKHVRMSLDIPEAIETFFGGGLVDGKWRVGYYLADQVVGSLGRSLPDLAALTVEEARAAVRDALDA